MFNYLLSEIQSFFIWKEIIYESVLYQGYKSFDPVLIANCEKRLGKAAFGENQNLYVERTQSFLKCFNCQS